MKQLNEYGYLKYQPSFNPFKGSLVYLFNFETTPVHQPTPLRTVKGTGSEQEIEPYTNRINCPNQTTFTKGKNLKNKVGEKKPNFLPGKNVPPTLAEVNTFFNAQNSPSLEADKFYNYFCSTGWLIGGKTKMKDWQAAARNWMINTKNYSNESSLTDQNRAGNLHSTNTKNYNEPL
jgi:hypothetical protein